MTFIFVLPARFILSSLGHRLVENAAEEKMCGPLANNIYVASDCKH